jgi:hypothetical protein
MNVALAIRLVGVLFLGLFIGGVLALSIRSSGTKGRGDINARKIRFIIAAALSGAPVLLMKGLDYEKWMYPIGLVIGLSLLRVIAARDVISAGRDDSERNRFAHIFAWIDMLGISLVLGAVIACIILFT